MVKRDRVKKILAWTFIGVVLALLYAPILIIIILSFNNTRTFGAWGEFSFEPYIRLFTGSGSRAIGSAVLNSLLIALSASAIAVVLGTLAAIGIHSMRRVPKTIMGAVNQIPVVNACIVTAFALMIFFSMLNIVRGYATLIIAHVLICTPYVVLSVTPRLKQLNPHLYEAALDLGAGPLRAMFTVILPQLLPGMLAGGLLAFTLSLDDYVITAYNKGSSGIHTISTYIFDSYRTANTMPELRALSAIIFLVILGLLIVINIRAARAAKLKQKPKDN